MAQEQSDSTVTESALGSPPSSKPSNAPHRTLSEKAEQTAPIALALFCFFIPLKLSLAYCALYPYLVASLIANWKEIKIVANQNAPIFLSFAVFLSFAILASVAGIDPLRSLTNLPSVLIYSLLVPAVAAQSLKPDGSATLQRAAVAVIFGQTLAGFHSVFNSALDDTLPKFLIGSVTESGQLSLLIPFAFGLLIMMLRDGALPKQKIIPAYCIGIVISCATLITGFATPGFRTAAVFLLLALYIGLALYLFTQRKHVAATTCFAKFLVWFAIPILVGAIFVNLKRGPWLGVLCGMGIFVLITNRKLIIPLAAAVLLTVTCVTPVQRRLVASTKDFFMRGGRNDIWEIGTELIQRYPLGIGYKNSAFLQKFNSEIPPELKHFHSNFLNILVETGWFGLLAYLVFLFAAIRLAFTATDSKYKILTIAIGAALVSWQVAGLVEYSFGDSEVVLISYLLIGFLLGIKYRERLQSAELSL